MYPIASYPLFIFHSIEPSKHILTLHSTTTTTTYERPTRLKGKSDEIKWIELLDKFKAVQERARRAAQAQYNNRVSASQGTLTNGATKGGGDGGTANSILSPSRTSTPAGTTPTTASANPGKTAPARGGLGGIGRLAAGRRVRR